MHLKTQKHRLKFLTCHTIPWASWSGLLGIHGRRPSVSDWPDTEAQSHKEYTFLAVCACVVPYRAAVISVSLGYCCVSYLFEVELFSLFLCLKLCLSKHKKLLHLLLFELVHLSLHLKIQLVQFPLTILWPTAHTNSKHLFNNRSFKANSLQLPFNQRPATFLTLSEVSFFGNFSFFFKI